MSQWFPKRVSVSNVHEMFSAISAVHEWPPRLKPSSASHAAPEEKLTARLLQPMTRKRLRSVVIAPSDLPRSTGSPTKRMNKNRPASIAVDAK